MNGSAKLPLTSISVSATAHEKESKNNSKLSVRFQDEEQTTRLDEVVLEELELLKEQVALLQSSLNDKDIVSRISASRLLKILPELEQASRDPSRISQISEEVKNIANSLSGNTVPNQWVRNVTTRAEPCPVDIPKDGNLKFRPRSQSGSNTKPQRPVPRSLRNDNELKELHFVMKKNF